MVAAGEGTREDVPSWLEIAREVEPLFGPMPEFEATLLRNIARGTALCVRDASGQVLGGALLGALADTFGADSIEGHPARRLYESFGFVPAEHLPRGPEGGSRQRFRLRRD